MLLFFCLFLLVLAGPGESTSFVQVKRELRGLKSLIKPYLPKGVFLTCQIALFSEIVNFTTADTRCSNFSLGWSYNQGNLVTIGDGNKTEALKMLLEMAYPDSTISGMWNDKQWVWAGLRKINNLFVTDPGVYNRSDWQWSNGDEPGDYSKWMTSMPDGAKRAYGVSGCNQKPYCYQFQMRANHKGSWDDTYSYKTSPYACDYQGKYFISGKHRTWEAAKAHCEKAGLTMAKIRSTSELAEFMAMADYFLGEQDMSLGTWDASNWIWVGGSDLNDEGDWEWVDNGNEVEDWALPWKPNAGNDNARYLKQFRESGQDALAVSRWGQFDDSYVLVRKRPFGCQCKST